jgi:hypothetical protein
LGNSERLGLTGLKTGHYKTITKTIKKGRGAFRWIAKAPLEEGRASRGCPGFCLLDD